MQMTGFVWARVALAFALGGASFRILHHSMDFRVQISRDLAAAVSMAFDHTGSSERNNPPCDTRNSLNWLIVTSAGVMTS